MQRCENRLDVCIWCAGLSEAMINLVAAASFSGAIFPRDAWCRKTTVCTNRVGTATIDRDAVVDPRQQVAVQVDHRPVL